MGLFTKSCSVCANREICEAVDRLLDEKPRSKTLEQIAQSVGGVSKSSVHRHSKHHSPSALPRIYRGERFHVLWEGDTVPDSARPEDWLVIIEYEKPLVILKPPPPEIIAEEIAVPPETIS